VSVGLRLLGTAFLPLLAALVAVVLNRLAAVWLHAAAPPGLPHGVVVGSLVVVGALSYRWTGRAAIAVGIVLASICVTLLAALVLLLWALGTAFE
jgi:hypothetical protein